MPPTPLLEICVDSPDSLSAALSGGADRIELCSALAQGGLTPGAGLMAAAQSASVPCHAMIRPRNGDFILRDGDLSAMLVDIAVAKHAGLAGLVIGVSRGDGTLDEGALRRLIAEAEGLSVTLHRAFDLTPDPFAALETALGLGVTRILTSGQAPSALEGAEMIGRLVVRAAGRMEIMAGGGVVPQQAERLLACGVDALHASCSAVDTSACDTDLLGVAPRRVTQASQVAALKDRIEQGMLCS